jgi:hypothetical protein
MLPPIKCSTATHHAEERRKARGQRVLHGRVCEFASGCDGSNGGSGWQRRVVMATCAVVEEIASCMPCLADRETGLAGNDHRPRSNIERASPLQTAPVHAASPRRLPPAAPVSAALHALYYSSRLPARPRASAVRAFGVPVAPRRACSQGDSPSVRDYSTQPPVCCVDSHARSTTHRPPPARTFAGLCRDLYDIFTHT